MKLRPTDPLVALLPEEDSPHMVSLAMFATVILVSRTWSPGKNTIVVLEVKYSSACDTQRVWYSWLNSEGRMSMR